MVFLREEHTKWLSIADWAVQKTYIQAAFYYTMDWLYLGMYVYVYMHTVALSKDYAISQK